MHKDSSPNLKFLIKIGKDEGTLVHQCFCFSPLHTQNTPLTP